MNKQQSAHTRNVLFICYIKYFTTRMRHKWLWFPFWIHSEYCNSLRSNSSVSTGGPELDNIHCINHIWSHPHIQNPSPRTPHPGNGRHCIGIIMIFRPMDRNTAACVASASSETSSKDPDSWGTYSSTLCIKTAWSKTKWIAASSESCWPVSLERLNEK